MKKKNCYMGFVMVWEFKMGKHEYWLIKRITTTGHKNPLQIEDRTTADTLRQAEREFKRRNNFERLLKKADLTICESKLFIQ